MKLKLLDALRLRALLWLLLAITIAFSCAKAFIGHSPLQTNLLALLPQTERNPVAEEAVNQLADVAGNRAVFLIGHRSDKQAFDAARSFAQDLDVSNGFRHVFAEIPAVDPKQLTNFYLPYRFNLLSDADRLALKTHKPNLAELIQKKLYAPFRFGLTLSAAEDPFGFTDNWLADLPLKNLNLEPENGLLVSHQMGMTWVFVTAELSGSAYNGEVQNQVVDIVKAAEKKLHNDFSELQILRTGTVFYADAARQSAEHEVDRIGAVSLIGMLLLLYIVFRSMRPLALGLLSVGFGIGAAIAVTIAVYGEIHLITLVFGASLIGEAIDYAIQYFAAHLGAGKQWEPIAGLRKIASGLTVALITSLLGYCALLLAPFPALSQIALFAIVGLSAAWLSVFLLLPALLTKPTKRDATKVVALPQQILNKWQNNISKRASLLLAATLLIISISGWLQLKSNDDIHLLITRAPDLAAQEDSIREIIGFTNSSQFFLIEGDTPEAVLINEEKLTARLNSLITTGEISAYQAISMFAPSSARQSENRALWASNIFNDEVRLKIEFSNADLRDEIAPSTIAAFKASPHQQLMVDDWLNNPFSAPFRHLWMGKTTHGYASIIMPQGVKDIQSLKTVTLELPSVTFVDKVGSISALFQKYRQWSALWLLCAVAIIYLVLCVRYHWRQAALILMPTMLAMSLALSIFGYLHIPLTLFNMMGLMLVLGVGVNYAIFLREGGINAAATLAGVLLSAGTTLLSFGMLAFSSMPALSSFGLTLLIGVGIAALLAPMLLSFDVKPSKKMAS